jgi:hypothetical protein
MAAETTAQLTPSSVLAAWQELLAEIESDERATSVRLTVVEELPPDWLVELEELARDLDSDLPLSQTPSGRSGLQDLPTRPTLTLIRGGRDAE